MPGITKGRVYDILSIRDPGDTATRLANGFLIVLLLANVAAFFLQTFEDISSRYAYMFQSLEVFSVAIFSVEYALRVWVADLDPMYAGPVTGRIRYVTTDILSIIDLVAILPFYLEAVPAGGRTVRPAGHPGPPPVPAGPSGQAVPLLGLHRPDHPRDHEAAGISADHLYYPDGPAGHIVGYHVLPRA